MNKVLVIGGSGVLGSAVVNVLKKQSIPFLIGSRSPVKQNSYSMVNRSAEVPWKRVDLASGSGLTEALAGIDTVMHLASGKGKIGHESFEAGITRNLLNAIKRSDVKHLIYSSIVGIDKIPFSYYQAKLEAEVLIRQSQVPYTILRATQFHNLIDFWISKLLSLPVGFVPKSIRFQPIHVDTVAQKLHELAEAGNQQATLNLGGPDICTLGTLTKQWMNYRKVSKLIVPVPAIGRMMGSLVRGENTCAESDSRSKSWEAYLSSRYGS
ncbi:NAD(P)H-binding protein [Spirosoma sp. SC4-14]|uniref:SDR family oxidoreductase n=1 Tax=Spirosoma sp. SC4-14 TaxID=3128900 RepID=UPI0030CB0117